MRIQPLGSENVLIVNGFQTVMLESSSIQEKNASTPSGSPFDGAQGGEHIEPWMAPG
jgi:hypothetical protein